MRLVVLTLLFAVLAASASAVEILSVDLEGVMTPAQVDQFISVLFDGYDPPEASYGVNIYLMMIRSMHPSGTMTDVRVQVILPRTGDVMPRGAYLFTAGSTGLVNVCRSSREHEAGIRWGLYRAHVLSFAGQGFIGILPDYIGYEDWDLLQPYFHADSEARIVADAIAAVDLWLRSGAAGPRGIMPDMGSGLTSLTKVAAGFSQGGHAVFAAADQARLQPIGLRLDGVIGYGPTTGVEELFLEYPSVGPMVVQSYSMVYGSTRFDPYQILLHRYAETLEYDTTRQCVGGMQSYYPGTPEQLFERSFLDSLRAGTLGRTHPQIASILEQNRTGLAHHGVPALILQGTNDIVIDRRTQDKVVAAMVRVGNPVDYRVYQGSRHDTRQISFPDVVAWIDGLTEE
jgi:alpha-beta hydrolase superfamily lysophospholipase